MSLQGELFNEVGTKVIYKPTISNSKSGNEKDQSSTSVSLEEELYYKTRDFGQLKVGETILFIKVSEFRQEK